MDSKFFIVLGLLIAFFLGTGASGLTSKAFNVPEQDSAITSAPQSIAAPIAPRARPVATARSVDRVPVRSTAPVAKKRTWQKEALIVGGSAGAGAAVGAVAGGKKGAAIGAVSGGVAGLIYDLATRNKK
jgi:hypothetical protein